MKTPRPGYDPGMLAPPEDDDSLDFNIEELQAVERFVNIKTAAYKTVDTFAGLTKKRLWLRNGEAGTDGNEIRAPFESPEFYRLVEEQLAHILFRTDARAKRTFVEEYSAKVEQIAKQRNVPVSKPMLAQALASIITTLERRRVQDLWGRLYFGSHELMRENDKARVAPLLPEAHKNLLYLTTCLAAAPEDVGKGQYDRYRPYIEEALRKVEGRGFVASLAVSKWLVMQLVNEIIREAKDQPPPPPPPPSSQQQSQGGGGGQGAGGSEQQDEDQEAEDPQPQGGDQDEDEENEDDEGEGDQPGRWNPPSPEASAEDRAQALGKLLMSLGQPPPSISDTVTESQFKKGRADSKSSATSNAALNSPVNKAPEFEQQLDASQAEMEELLEQAKAAMRQQVREDDWLQKDAMAKIVFIDEPKPLVPRPLDYEDQQTVQRLRALFYRVMGRRSSRLVDTGTEVDIPALIERRMSGQPLPVFKEEGRARGFRAHLVLDLSGSMMGPKLQQCERAARIIQRALKFPFVSFDIWGFTSHEPGEAKLTRFDPKGDIQLSMQLKGSGGYTPLHVALRVAARKMQESHDDKQMFVITDGFPVHKRRDGREFSTRQLLLMARNEIRTARKDGTRVVGVVLGAKQGESTCFDLSERDMGFMFGNRRNWRALQPDRIGQDLVQLVATSFVDFLSK